jgi:glycosyltransferase involved in cell wall biosynthesis
MRIADMRRIALVTPILPVAHDPTRGRYIHETARSLARIATLRAYFPQPRYPRLPGLAPRSFLAGHVGADYTLDGVDVEAFGYPALPGLSRISNGFAAARALTRRLRAFAPDLVLAYWIYPDGYAALRSARRLDVPCVIGARGSDIHVRSGLTEFMTRHTIAGADRLLTVSQAMRRTAIERYAAAPDKVSTIINGFDTAVFHPRPQDAMRRHLGIAADARLVVYVGRLVETKGMRELVEAFSRLAARDPALLLALVGDGVMRGELDALIRDRGLAGRILMPGGFGPERVAEWIAAADLLTLPSWSEGYPNVVVEAIACGRPVVATDVGGTREIVGADTGLLIPPRDAAALERALDQALRARWDHAAIAASMHRSWEDVAAETLAVCEATLAQYRRRR